MTQKLLDRGETPEYAVSHSQATTVNGASTQCDVHVQYVTESLWCNSKLDIQVFISNIVKQVH